MERTNISQYIFEKEQSKKIIKKKNKVGYLSDIKTYYKAIVIKSEW